MSDFSPASLTRREFVGIGVGLLATPRLAQAQAQAKSRLILLGTAGGPTPKPNRSAPSQVIVVNGVSYVIDCGSGVARQMILAGLKLGSIRGVFLTHQHSDHNADVGNLLLLSWASDLARKVDVYGPPPIGRMMRQFLELNAADIRTRIADEGRPPIAGLIATHEMRGAGLVMRDGNVKVTAAVVNHPPVTPSFAYRFDCPDRSIVISGDTAPSDALIRLARGADVLVHEVMHVPSIEQIIVSEPNAKTLREHLIASHTTTEQVGRIATEAGVKTLVLSHFVPGGFPFLSDEAWLDAVRPHYPGRLIVGRDLLEI
ncbi:MAG: MBL fold metallo-hydrolase [Gemmatimonadaceae bacterium]